MADAATGQMRILEAVELKRRRASARALDVSFNELAEMRREGALITDPEYQRTFRWSITKQSQFIESVILEMPVPPIYALEVEEGKWELIDGLQRVSTYLHFRGQLELDTGDLETTIKLGNQLILEGCDIIPELNGSRFEGLPTTIQQRIRRTPLRVEVVRRDSDPRFAFYMFVRLNQGGEPISDMEARNCSIRILDEQRTFVTFLRDVAANPDFVDCTFTLTEDKEKQMYREELALRYFAFKNLLNEYVHDIAPFLTNYM